MIEITKNKIELEALLNGSNIMIELIHPLLLKNMPDQASDLELLIFSSYISKLYLNDVFCILDKSFDFEDDIQNIMFQEKDEFEKSKTPSYKEIKYLIKKEIYDIKIIKVQDLTKDILNEIKFIGEFKDWFNSICLEEKYELNYEDNPYIILYYIKNLKNNIFSKENIMNQKEISLIEIHLNQLKQDNIININFDNNYYLEFEINDYQPFKNLKLKFRFLKNEKILEMFISNNNFDYFKKMLNECNELELIKEDLINKMRINIIKKVLPEIEKSLKLEIINKNFVTNYDSGFHLYVGINLK